MEKYESIIRSMLVIVLVASATIIVGLSIETGRSYQEIPISNTKIVELKYKITEDEIIRDCNKTGFSDLQKMNCLVIYYDGAVTYKSCSSENRTEPQEAMYTINRGYGCCMDSSEFYSHFLGEFGIAHEVESTATIDTPMAHRYVRAIAIGDNGTYYEVRLDNDDMFILATYYPDGAEYVFEEYDRNETNTSN